MQLVINVLNKDCCRRKRKICGTCDGSVNGILLMMTPYFKHCKERRKKQIIAKENRRKCMGKSYAHLQLDHSFPSRSNNVIDLAMK